MKTRLYYILLAILGILALVGCKGQEKPHAVTNRFRATIDGRPTNLYTISNTKGMTVEVTNYGGRIVSIRVPDKTGTMRDVVLGFDSIADYVNVPGNNFGAIIGRYGNRIENGRFSLDGKEYQLPQNNFGHCLHGGDKGYFARVWNAKKTENNKIELSLLDPDGEAGFPGNLEVRVIYELREDNSLVITYEATTDAPTIVNLTNHSYFNLGVDHSRNILDHVVMINADKITPIDSTFMTHGSTMDVAGTPFDFRKPKTVGRDIKADHPQLRNGRGYDHNFVLNTGGDKSKVAASVYNPSTGIMLEVMTSEPGLQFYVGNFLDGKVRGKAGAEYPYRGAICLETQHFPNSPNCPSYPSVTLRPGELYKSVCVYKFSVVNDDETVKSK